jgi:hypothetical protein
MIEAGDHFGTVASNCQLDENVIQLDRNGGAANAKVITFPAMNSRVRDASISFEDLQEHLCSRSAANL